MTQHNENKKFVKIKVIPNAKKSEFAGEMSDGTIKIRVKAIPENGKANVELLNFLEKSTNNQWRLVSWKTNSIKILQEIPSENLNKEE